MKKLFRSQSSLMRSVFFGICPVTGETCSRPIVEAAGLDAHPRAG